MTKTICVVILGMLMLSGCAQQAEQTDQAKDGSKSPAAVPVTIAQYGHVFLYMPLYVAMRKGFFKKNGLEVTLVSTGGDEKTFTAVATGNAQFGVSDPTFVAIAREHGQRGKVVAAVVRGVPFWVVSLKKDIGQFSKPEQFNNYRCAAYTAPSTCYAVMKKILADGKADKARIIQGAFGTLPALLKSDQADMALEIEPTVSIVVNDGGHVVYSPKDVLGDFAFTGLEVSEQYAQEHPDQIKSCVEALREAMQYIHEDFDGAVEVAKEEFPDVKPDVVKEALSRLRESETIPNSPILPESAWNSAIALRKDLGDLKSEGSFSENVDMSFVDAAISSAASPTAGTGTGAAKPDTEAAGDKP